MTRGRVLSSLTEPLRSARRFQTHALFQRSPSSAPGSSGWVLELKKGRARAPVRMGKPRSEGGLQGQSGGPGPGPSSLPAGSWLPPIPRPTFNRFLCLFLAAASLSHSAQRRRGKNGGRFLLDQRTHFRLQPPTSCPREPNALPPAGGLGSRSPKGPASLATPQVCAPRPPHPMAVSAPEMKLDLLSLLSVSLRF